MKASLWPSALLGGALLVSLVQSGLAEAATYDPALTWRTLSTPHFKIHFHGGEEQLAEEVARIAEPIWEEMTRELAFAPSREIEVVLVDNTDLANGYALTVPLNTIVIYVTAPTEDNTLSDYEDWNQVILTHELTHILHLDLTRGLPRALRYVFGRIVSTNRITPAWVIEGYATFQETRHTPIGRGRSAYADMIKRMATLEQAIPPLGSMDGFQVAPPSGNIRYLFGQDFTQYIAETRGETVWTEYFHRYGAGVPYFMPTKASFDARFRELHEEWSRSLESRYAAQKARIEAQGLTPFRLLSDGEDQCAAPTFSPDGGRLVWSCNDLQAGPKVWLADGEGQGAKELLDQRFANDFAWRPDGEAFAFSAVHLVDRWNIYSDIYFYQLNGSLSALTNGERARNPAFSPDGRDLLFVTNEAQQNQLRRQKVDQSIETLLSFPDHTQLATPRWSPDGRHVAVSLWRDGQRDIYLMDAEGGLVRRVTADTAEDIDPAWSNDGRTLYFSSDRSGIFNIYAVHLPSENLFQVTNVLGGAFNPSPRADGKLLAFEAYSNNGMDIAIMDLAPEHWFDLGPIPPPIHHATPFSAILPEDGWTPRPPAPPVDAANAAAVEPPGRKNRFRVRKANFGSNAAPPPFPGLDGLGGSHFALQALEGPTGHPFENRFPGEFSPDAPVGGVNVDDPSRTGDRTRAEQDFDFSYPVERYRSWPTLAPRYLVPTGSLTQYGFRGALATGGSDTLRRWLYSAFASYQTDANFFGWGASLSANHLLPVFTAGAYTQAIAFGTLWELDQPSPEGGPWTPSIQNTGELYWEDRLTTYAQVAWPINEYQALFLRWAGEFRRPKDELSPQTYRPLLASRGFLSSIGAGWNLYRGRAYSRSISPEEARLLSIAGQLSSHLLGSYLLDDTDQPVAFDRLQLTAEWREYRTLPWANNHVIATRLAGGASLGDQLRQGSFRLGGTFGESSAYTLPTELRPLRGFPVATANGDWFYLGSAEYRLPVAWFDRGFGPWPVFFRSLSAAGFVDVGNAFYVPTEDTAVLAATRVGTGAELGASGYLSWGIPVSLSMGYGFGVIGDGAISFGSLEGLYLRLGGTF